MKELPSSTRDLKLLFKSATRESVLRGGTRSREQLEEIEQRWRQASTIELTVASSKEELFSACENSSPYVQELLPALRRLMDLCDSSEDGIRLLPLMGDAPESIRRKILVKAFKLTPHSTARTISKLLREKEGFYTPDD
ncbi:hypothetical protein KW796_01055 [Candidatus Parcubacteria bacterium]|nr:hypothetical protein [Candidatus Parcubacteria bacterium]